MVVAIFNSTGDSFWIPAYSLNDRVYESGFLFVIFAFFQISIYIFTGYVIVRTCWIFLSIKVFHENMNILMAWFLLQWFEAILAKIVIIPYQIGLIVIGIDSKKTYYDWWASDENEMIQVRKDIGSSIIPLYISSYFLWHYMYSILFAILAIGLERVCATYYIQ
uniref:7TM_GPCR_Srx domain-containing protein n=1 Tax=Caenorhabditis tropicalis TaxID=1561998 RepID=A0A1I7U3N4_9PELO